MKLNSLIVASIFALGASAFAQDGTAPAAPAGGTMEKTKTEEVHTKDADGKKMKKVKKEKVKKEKEEKKAD